MIRRTLAPIVCFLLLAPAAEAVPVEQGKVKLGATALKIAGGNIENGEGTLRLKGKVKADGVVLRGLQIDLRANGIVTARTGGLRQPVFTVKTGKAKVGTNPTKIRIRKVQLVPTGALDRGRQAAADRHRDPGPAARRRRPDDALARPVLPRRPDGGARHARRQRGRGDR